MSYTLFELNEFIRQVLALNLSEPLWIKCEISQANISRGHCYLNLVQKAENGEEVIAQSSAVLWSLKLRQLRNKLGFELDTILQEGMEVMLQVKVDFHERFGLKLLIEDIDPGYTLGQLALKRMETISRLKKEGLLEKNKRFNLPVVIQRVAILSSESAAGLKDFLNEMAQNEYGYRFQFHLFPVAMQGAKVSEEIQAVLKKILPEQFDVIVVVRGGGSKMDLAAFDEFLLCKSIALAPLPVISGIGHEIDETVLDKVAHTSLRTPTAVAGFIIHYNLRFESALMQLAAELKGGVHTILQKQQQTVRLVAQSTISQLDRAMKQQTMMLKYIDQELPGLFSQKLKLSAAGLSLMDRSIQLLDPQQVLKRGFTITLKQGKMVKDGSDLEPGDELETVFYKNKTRSVVTVAPGKQKTSNQQ